MVCGISCVMYKSEIWMNIKGYLCLCKGVLGLWCVDVSLMMILGLENVNTSTDFKQGH